MSSDSESSDALRKKILSSWISSSNEEETGQQARRRREKEQREARDEIWKSLSSGPTPREMISMSPAQSREVTDRAKELLRLEESGADRAELKKLLDETQEILRKNKVRQYEKMKRTVALKRIDRQIREIKSDRGIKRLSKLILIRELQKQRDLFTI